MMPGSEGSKGSVKSRRYFAVFHLHWILYTVSYTYIQIGKSPLSLKMLPFPLYEYSIVNTKELWYTNSDFISFHNIS